MLARRAFLNLTLGSAVLGLAACASEEVPASFAPLRYDYLTPLRLSVASVEVKNEWVPGPTDVTALSPEPPEQALERMAHDRLFPAGSSGRAVFVIIDASIVPQGDNYAGNLDVRLDIFAGGGDRTAYAEARVTRVRSIPGGEAAKRAALYDMTKRMMDDMNVEFEYQVRRALKDWLQATTPTAVPAPVEQQNLSVPPGANAAPAPTAPASTAAPGGPAAAPPPGLSPPAGTLPASPGLTPLGAPTPLSPPPAS
jgi:hypothetical protein